jgi:hypothetical protein
VLEPIHTFVPEAMGSSRDAFVARRPEGALVVAPFVAEEDPRFQTIAGSPRVAGGVTWVGLIAKRAGSNVFTSMVTIGRARNNDLEVNAATVSKFHAYIMLEDGPVLVDAGSTYGTFVHEKKLVPRRERHPLRPGDTIRLGSIYMTYHDPCGLYDLLRREGMRRASA